MATKIRYAPSRAPSRAMRPRHRAGHQRSRQGVSVDSQRSTSSGWLSVEPWQLIWFCSDSGPDGVPVQRISSAGSMTALRGPRSPSIPRGPVGRGLGNYSRENPSHLRTPDSSPRNRTSTTSTRSCGASLRPIGWISFRVCWEDDNGNIRVPAWLAGPEQQRHRPLQGRPSLPSLGDRERAEVSSPSSRPSRTA